jgi:phage baseplate assembly protein W
MLINSDFLGQGFAYPLRPVGTGTQQSNALSWSSGAEDIRQSIGIILSTVPGQRVLVPSFGCRLDELAFAADNVATRGLAQRYVKQALDAWEPRIAVRNVTASVDPSDRRCMLVSIDYVIKEKNSPQNLVYPFYTQAS